MGAAKRGRTPRSVQLPAAAARRERRWLQLLQRFANREGMSAAPRHEDSNGTKWWSYADLGIRSISDQRSIGEMMGAGLVQKRDHRQEGHVLSLTDAGRQAQAVGRIES